MITKSEYLNVQVNSTNLINANLELLKVAKILNIEHTSGKAGGLKMTE